MSDDGNPEALIQWKGTDACLDLYCSCGAQFHYDGFFAAELTCGRCGQTHELPHTLPLRPVTPSRRLRLVFSGDWDGAPDDGYIRDGEFTIPWPQPAFTAVTPGGTFEVCDEAHGGFRPVTVKLIRADPAPGATMMLTVRNAGLTP